MKYLENLDEKDNTIYRQKELINSLIDENRKLSNRLNYLWLALIAVSISVYLFNS